MTAPRYRTGAANRHRRRFGIMDIFSDTAAIFVGKSSFNAEFFRQIDLGFRGSQ
jgi:hypothetical protein